MMKKPVSLLLAFAPWLLAGSAHAATLVTYNFSTQTSVDNAVSGNAVGTTPGFSATPFTAGTGLQGNVSGSDPAFSITGSSTTNPAGGSNTRHMFVRVGGTNATSATDEAGAVAANDYYTFTATPSAGFSLNLTSLNFDLARSGGSFTGNLFIRSSLDGFTSNLFSDTAASGSTGLTTTGLTLDSSFQNLTTPVEFRFYFADNGTTTTDNSVVFRLDNVVLSGDVIPEPGSAALLAFGALGLAFRRRAR